MSLEYEDGSMSKPMELTEAFEHAGWNKKIKAIHMGTKEELDADVEKAKYKRAESSEQRLDRLESMLSSIIVHLNIPYKGILKG